jgi:hypothetical protein
VHSLAHAIRLERLIERCSECRAVHADIEVDRLGGFIQTIEMGREEGNPPAMHPQSLPYSIAEDEPGVEHRNHRLGARTQCAIDIDEDVAIARIVGGVMCAGSHAVTWGRSPWQAVILARQRDAAFDLGRSD